MSYWNVGTSTDPEGTSGTMDQQNGKKLHERVSTILSQKTILKKTTTFSKLSLLCKHTL